jgi:hypothetical protein
MTQAILIHDIPERDRMIRGSLVKGKVHVGHHAEIHPGESIRIFGIETNRHGGPLPYDRTFRIGARCEIDSYNFRYLGTIVQISGKGITVRDDLGGRKRRLTIATFAWRNRDFDLVKIETHNATEMQCL